MDLRTVDDWLQPTSLDQVSHWSPEHAWVAGGTWLFSEAQPRIRTLVDLQRLGWSELEATPEGLMIGATCVMSRLLSFSYPADWTSVQALQAAVHELASFKVQSVATVAGNLCLAIPAGTFAPVMVGLDAVYTVVSLDGSSRQVPAQAFQLGAQHTCLAPGEVLRWIQIPVASLRWRVNYQRLCIAAAGLAVAIVVTVQDPVTTKTRFVIGGSLPKPEILEFAKSPSAQDLLSCLDERIPFEVYLNDFTAGRAYRRQTTAVLMARGLAAVSGKASGGGCGLADEGKVSAPEPLFG